MEQLFLFIPTILFLYVLFLFVPLVFRMVTSRILYVYSGSFPKYIYLPKHKFSVLEEEENGSAGTRIRHFPINHLIHLESK